MTRFKVYLKSILIPVVAGGIVGLLISGFIDYDSLIKPAFSPSSTVFPIVWTVLYLLMGISYGILEDKNLMTSESKLIYYTQLVFNLLWPIAFFIFKWRLFAFVWILILDALVAVMIINFYKKNRLAGSLQIPYLIWTVFASYLNLGVYLLNK